MYREAHSLKGAARSVNMTRIEAVCQAAESVFASLKAGRIGTSTELFDTLHRAADIMGELLQESENRGRQGYRGSVVRTGTLSGEVKPSRAAEQPPPAKEASAPQDQPPSRKEVHEPAQPAGDDVSLMKTENPEASEHAGTAKVKNDSSRPTP